MERKYSASNEHSNRIIGIMACIAVLSIVLYVLFSSYVGYGFVTKPIDEKKGTVMQLLTASTAASAVITVIPDDIGTPIAEQLTDLSTGFLVVLAVLYCEKYLFPLFMFLALCILGPLACLAYAAHKNTGRWNMKLWFKRFLALAVLLITVIPISIMVSNSIERTFEDSIKETYNSAIEMEEEVTETDEEGRNIFQKIIGAAQDAVSGVSKAIEMAKSVLGHFVEAIAIMIVTNCVIPIVVVLIYWKALQAIFGTKNIGIQQISDSYGGLKIKRRNHTKQLRRSRNENEE